VSLSCSGVTPDGLPFEISDSDPQSSRSIQGAFPATEELLSVFLAIPVERQGGRNCLLEETTESPETRYIAEEIALTDDNTGADERQIEVARTNFQIRFGGEPMEGFSTMKIAEVLRTADGGFSLSDSYIPPSLSISASENLMTIARRLLELLVAKSSDLLDRRQQRPSGQIEYTSSDITVFWLLHTVNTFIPLLNNHYTIGKIHPKEFYTLLLSLAGQLTTFSTDVLIHPRDFPIYDHKDLSNCFIQLDELVRKQLGEVVSTNIVSIPLDKQRESLYVAQVRDDSLFKEAQFFLVGSGDIPENKIVNDLPIKVRIASPDRIDAVLQSFTLALNISHSKRPPMGLPARPGFQYFHLEKHGPFWEEICQSRALAIFLPAELKGLKLEVVAVREAR
jgi:type VI secretion system protein ImpJ